MNSDVRNETTPLVPVTRGGARERLLWWGAGVALRASLVVSPRPAALLVRRVFASGGAETARALAEHAPPEAEVIVLRDERYGDEDDMLLDVVRPAASQPERLPLVVWVHGGGWVGGAKEELTSYFMLLASNGYAVAGPRYALAPEHRYPTPLRQTMRALAYLRDNAERLRLDTDRIVLAGDSAGAQIAAQVAALVTTPGYAEAIGVPATITAAQLRGLVLACGPYDIRLLSSASSATGRRLTQAVLWAYSGKRHFLDDSFVATASVADHVTPAFPPALITVGNVDPLRPHSALLAEKLRAQGVEVETVFFPDDYQPPLNHEYQFDLGTAAGQLFLDHTLAFLRRRLGAVQQV